MCDKGKCTENDYTITTNGVDIIVTRYLECETGKCVLIQTRKPGKEKVPRKALYSKKFLNTPLSEVSKRSKKVKK